MCVTERNQLILQQHKEEKRGWEAWRRSEEDRGPHAPHVDQSGTATEAAQAAQVAVGQADDVLSANMQMQQDIQEMFAKQEDDSREPRGGAAPAIDGHGRRLPPLNGSSC